MKISFLEAKLAEIREQIGDIEVGVVTSDGEFFCTDTQFMVDIVGIPNEDETEEETICGLLSGEEFYEDEDLKRSHLKIVREH